MGKNEFNAEEITKARAICVGRDLVFTSTFNLLMGLCEDEGRRADEMHGERVGALVRATMFETFIATSILSRYRPDRAHVLDCVERIESTLRTALDASEDTR